MTERIFNALHTQTFDPSFVHWRLMHDQYKAGALNRKRQVKQSGNILK
jgi:hypothetical protein